MVVVFLHFPELFLVETLASPESLQKPIFTTDRAILLLQQRKPFCHQTNSIKAQQGYASSPPFSITISSTLPLATARTSDSSLCTTLHVLQITLID